MVRISTVLGVVSMLAACNPSLPWEEMLLPQDDFSGNSVGSADLENPSIDAQVGRFSANDQGGWGQFHDWGYGFTVDVRGQENGIVMAWLEMQNVRVDSLNEGEVFTGTYEDYYSSGTEPVVYMLGCAGDIEDYWEEDYPVDEVEVEVTNVTDEDVTINFTGTIDYTGQEVSGQATIPVHGG